MFQSKTQLIFLSPEVLEPPEYLKPWIFERRTAPAFMKDGTCSVINNDSGQLVILSIQIKTDPAPDTCFKNGKYIVQPRMRNNLTDAFIGNQFTIEFYAFKNYARGLNVNSFNRDILTLPNTKALMPNSDTLLLPRKFYMDHPTNKEGTKVIFFSYATANTHKSRQAIPINMMLERHEVNGKDNWTLHRLRF